MLRDLFLWLSVFIRGFEGLHSGERSVCLISERSTEGFSLLFRIRDLSGEEKICSGVGMCGKTKLNCMELSAMGD